MVELEQVFKTLTDHGVDFVVIGGVAMFAHGSAHITNDLDFAYRRTRENTERIYQALKQFNPRPRGFPESLPFVFDSNTLLNGTNFTFITDVGDIDLLGEVAGIGTYNEVEAASFPMDILGYEVKVIGLDGLIAAKTAAGRKKDLLALPELEALRDALSKGE